MTFTPLLNTAVIIAISLYVLTTLTKYFGYTVIRKIKIAYWSIPLTITFIYCFAVGFISSTAILFSILFLVSSYFVNKGTSSLVRITSGVLAVTIFLALGFKMIPGFENQLLVDGQNIKSSSSPYFAAFNFDKTLAGLIFFLAVIEHSKTLISGVTILKVLLISLATATFVLGVGSITGIIEYNTDYMFNYKLILLFITLQVFSVCLAEEVLFRGFIQERLYRLFKTDSFFYKVIPLGVSSLLFGLVHYAGGIGYIITSALAGVGYGLVYQLTKRVEYSILSHTLLNVIHLMFFTYPFLESK